ncbi:hypothetical protein BDV93DRAFT_97881 [Ceratobasidium sp. AG-I]|nr:hypothetical protein BDV93DRAFT_97881 [Ceratobasidium sp. AG-I]
MYHPPPPSHLYDNQRQYNVLSEPSQISPPPDAGLSSSHRSRDHALPDELANTFHSGSAHNGFERASHYYAFPGANPTHSLTRRNLDEHNRLNEGINPSSRQLQNAPSQAYRGSDNRGFYKYKAAAPSASDGPARPSSAMAVIGSAYEGRPRMNAGMGGFGPDRFSQFLGPPGDAPSPVPAPPLPQQPRQFPLTRPNSRFTDQNQDKTRAMVEAFRAMQNEQDQERQRKWNAEHNIREEFKSDNMGMDQKRPPSQGSVQSNRSRAVTVISTSDEDDWTTGRRVTSMYNKPIAPELRSNMEGGSTSNTGRSRNEHAEKAALEAHARALEEARKLSEGEIDEEDDESVQRYVRSKFGVQIEDYNTESEMESSTDESTTTSESNREDPQPTINAAMMAHARALEAARKLAEGSLDDDDDDETSLQRK